MDDINEEPDIALSGPRGFRKRWRPQPQLSVHGDEPQNNPLASSENSGLNEAFDSELELVSQCEIFSEFELDSELYPNGDNDLEDDNQAIVEQVGDESFNADWESLQADSSFVPLDGSPFSTGVNAIGLESNTHGISNSRVQVVDENRTEDDWRRTAINSLVKRRRLNRIELPWEQPIYNQVLGRPSMLQSTVVDRMEKNFFTPTVIGCQDVLASTVVRDFRAPTLQPRDCPPVRRIDLKGARPEMSDDDIRRVALLKLEELIIQDPYATQLGCSIKTMLDEGRSRNLVMQSISDAFRGKASTTLQKRAGSLWKLAKVFRTMGIFVPLRFTEEDLYQALCHMREQSAGPTSLQHVIESLHFVHAGATLLLTDLHAVISGRVRGVAKDMFLTKRPLQQRNHFTVKQVKHLERAMAESPPSIQCIVGQVLFCIYACCRWRDSQKMVALTLTEGHGESLLCGEALTSKTTLSAESKSRYLPYSALGGGLLQLDWAKNWLSARGEMGLAFDGCVLPSFSDKKGQFIDRPMSASEGTFWIRDLLSDCTSEADLQALGTHSCKATLLTWAARSTLVRFTFTERRLMGHHLAQGVKSILCYSREAFTTLSGKVLQLLKTIRDNSFDPDASIIERVVNMASSDDPGQMQEPEPQEPGAEVVSDSDSSVATISDLTESADDSNQQPFFDRISKGHAFQGIPMEAWFVHRLSGVVHAASEDDFFLCGRRTSVNFKPFLSLARSARLFEPCAQCKKAYEASKLADA